LVAADLAAVDARLRALITPHDVTPPLDEVARHLVAAGGKRLRPRLVLLGARIARPGASSASPPTALALALSCAAELIHSASLLHDDVVDGADLRRGRRSSRTVWGNTYAVLAGDYCLALALTEVERTGSLTAIRTLNQTVRAMVDAEVAQLNNRFNPQTSKELYFRIIAGKTAALLSWCVSLAGLAEAETREALCQYGHHCGIAFQIADDLLDYRLTSTVSGKPTAQDLREGNITLPLIIACNRNPALREMVAALGQTAPQPAAEPPPSGGKQNTDVRTSSDPQSSPDPFDKRVERIVTTVHAAGGVQGARQAAQRHASAAIEALAKLPESPARQALADLAAFAADRSF
jgi:geranylgeranyl pyrophosphate synthase